MGLTDGRACEGVPEEIEDELTNIEERAYSLRKVLRLYGFESSEAPVYTALDEIRDGIVEQARTEVDTDPTNRSYFETGYGSAARITPTELVILPSAGTPSHYPLEAITNVHRTSLPAGTRAGAIFATAITDGREDAIGVDVLLREEGGDTLLVLSSGTSVDEAIERAADEVEHRIGGSWGCDDWFAAS